MKRLIVERQLLVKELWELPEDYDIEQPLHLQGQCRNRSYLHSSPITIRDYREGESLEPSLEQRALRRAEVGAWKKMMRIWKGHRL